MPEEGLILEWLGKAYYRAGLESAAIQQWEFALDQGHGGQLLQNTIEIIKGRRALENDFSVDERYVEAGDFFGSSNDTIYFGQPVGIVTNSDGSFWVSAYSTNELIQFDVNGTIIDRKRGPINGFDGPMDIERTVDNKILVSEFNGDRVSVLDENGMVLQLNSFSGETFRTSLCGEFNVDNVMLVLAWAKGLGISETTIPSVAPQSNSRTITS